MRPAPMRTALAALAIGLVTAGAMAQTPPPTWPTPTDVKPVGIGCEDCPYPYPSQYLPLNLYGQDLRLAYMHSSPRASARPAGRR